MTVDLKLAARQVETSAQPRRQSAAFASIVQHTQAPLFRYASRMMGRPAAAEDALQEAYLKAFRALRAGRFDGRSAVSTWLYRIVTNCCLDAMRKRRDVAGSDRLPDAGFDGRTAAAARQALRQLDGWLNDLSPEQRAVVILKAVEGMSTRDTARVLGVSEGAVEQRLVRARNQLRKRRDESPPPAAALVATPPADTDHPQEAST